MKQIAVPMVLGLMAALIATEGRAQTKSQDRGFQFGVIGDMPYPSKSLKEAVRVINAMNRQRLAFVVHVGDFQAGAGRYNRNRSAYKDMPCTDRNMTAILNLFQSSAHPFIFTPGDNDWTDCRKFKDVTFDPLKKLAKVRSMFFVQGRSLGRRAISVKNQSINPTYSKFIENQTWTMGGVVFVTLHIVGSNDNYTSGKLPKMDAEHRERRAANLAWRKKAFAAARSSAVRGLVIMAHANPRFENHWQRSSKRRYIRGMVGLKVKKKRRSSVYDRYTTSLRRELETFAKPVLYIHGSSHTFRVDKPLYGKKARRVFQNFTRLESFGAPDTHWVRVTVDPADPGLFSIRPEIIPKNRAHHRN